MKVYVVEHALAAACIVKAVAVVWWGLNILIA